jgi:hypothetical protein
MNILRETKGYKIGYLSITILLSAFVVYLYTISKIKDVEINYIYFFIYLVVVFFANVIRRIIVDVVSLLYLLFFIVYYFL